MSTVIDLSVRRAHLPADRGSVVDAIVEGAESFHALTSAWPLTPLREAHIIGAERSLVALQTLLVQLRRHVPARQSGDPTENTEMR
jgi:hypothetical protein